MSITTLTLANGHPSLKQERLGVFSGLARPRYSADPVNFGETVLSMDNAARCQGFGFRQPQANLPNAAHVTDLSLEDENRETDSRVAKADGLPRR